MRSYKDGEKVKIKANTNSHRFPIGLVVTITGNFHSNGGAARCKHPDYGTWWVRFTDMENNFKETGFAKFMKAIEERRSA